MSNKYIQGQINETEGEIATLNSKLNHLYKLAESTENQTDISKWFGFRFESSSGLTDEFAQFARDIKKHMTSILPEGCELVKFSRGHFDVWGFIKKDSKFVYFSIEDVRWNVWQDQILIREAKNDSDYTGGSNKFTNLERFADAVGGML